MRYKVIIALLLYMGTTPVAHCHVVEWRASVANDATWQLIQNVDRLDSGSTKQNFMTLDLVEKLIETQPRAALQYLNQASTLQPKLVDTFDYFKFKVLYKIGEYREAIALGSKLMQRPIVRNWQLYLSEKLIELHSLNQDWAQVAEHFRSASNRLGLSKISSETLRHVAIAYHKNGSMSQFYDVIENIASQFPHTNDARWAFHWLMDLSCENKPEHYVFSEELLRRLSWNTQVYPDLKEAILAIVEDRPVRLLNRQVVRMDIFGRLRMLMGLRFFDEVDKIGQEILVQRGMYSKRQVQGALELLARNAIRMADARLAAEYFIELMESVPGYVSSDNYSLADAMRYLSKYRTAHALYKKSPYAYDRMENTWQQFWMAYRGEDFESALQTLTEKEATIRGRDTDGNVAPIYWRAKILEKQGKIAESEALYKSVLAEAGQNYYATLILRKQPEIANAVQLSSEEDINYPPQKQKKEILLASIGELPTPMFTGLESDIATVEELISNELYDSARQKIADIIKRDTLNDESALKLHLLLNKAGDFEPKTRLLTKLSVLNFENGGGLADLNNQQKENNENWRVYYPRAYRDIVDKYAKQFGIEPLFFLSVMRAESYYREHASSIVGARGLVQIMPFTGIRIAKDLGDEKFVPTDLGKPKINIAYGAYYLSKLLQYYDNNPYVALAAYNAGPDAVNFWLESCKGCQIDEFVESIPFRETRRYVKKVSKYHQMYQNIYQRPTEFSNWPKLPENLGPISKVY